MSFISFCPGILSLAMSDPIEAARCRARQSEDAYYAIERLLVPARQRLQQDLAHLQQLLDARPVSPLFDICQELFWTVLAFLPLEAVYTLAVTCHTWRNFVRAYLNARDGLGMVEPSLHRILASGKAQIGLLSLKRIAGTEVKESRDVASGPEGIVVRDRGSRVTATVLTHGCYGTPVALRIEGAELLQYTAKTIISASRTDGNLVGHRNEALTSVFATPLEGPSTLMYAGTDYIRNVHYQANTLFLIAERDDNTRHSVGMLTPGSKAVVWRTICDLSDPFQRPMASLHDDLDTSVVAGEGNTFYISAESFCVIVVRFCNVNLTVDCVDLRHRLPGAPPMPYEGAEIGDMAYIRGGLLVFEVVGTPIVQVATTKGVLYEKYVAPRDAMSYDGTDMSATNTLAATCVQFGQIPASAKGCSCVCLWHVSQTSMTLVASIDTPFMCQRVFLSSSLLYILGVRARAAGSFTVYPAGHRTLTYELKQP